MSHMSSEIDYDIVKQWRSILTLVVFISTSESLRNDFSDDGVLIVTDGPILWPFRVPLYVPEPLCFGFVRLISTLRVCQLDQVRSRGPSKFARFGLPVNYVTAPLFATILLLVTSAIGWQEVRSGIVGNENTGIIPYDVVLVFLTLGYVANSIAASGLVRYLVCLVLPRGKIMGHRLYFYLYLSFFGLGMFIGNDPIMLLFLSSLTRVTENVDHPRAWVHTQFAIANIATGVLVSSNPTNLVLAGAFNMRFVGYMANMIVPTMATVLLLFPFLLYVVFHDEKLIPRAIMVIELPDEIRNRKPVNFNIPFSQGEHEPEDEETPKEAAQINVESILNPYLSKKGALAGSFVMIASVVILLTLNAVYLSKGGNTDFWVTLPAAFLMVCWDFALGWVERKETREISHEGRMRAEAALATRTERRRSTNVEELGTLRHSEPVRGPLDSCCNSISAMSPGAGKVLEDGNANTAPVQLALDSVAVVSSALGSETHEPETKHAASIILTSDEKDSRAEEVQPEANVRRVLTNLGVSGMTSLQRKDFGKERVTLVAILQDRYVWARATFPTTTVAATYLPWDIIPFLFSMVTLVEGLVSSGWMPVFARGWDWWATHTGVVGSIAGMGFLGAVLSNVSSNSC